jgi:hypothetical protein
MLQEAVRALIETLLNSNTDGVQFVVGQYAKKDDRNGDFIYNIKNGYKLLSKSYVPTMMVFNCDYTPIYLTKTGYATVSLDFLLPTTEDTVDADFNLKTAALDAFIGTIIGAHLSFYDGAKLYHAQWSATAFTNPKPLEVLNGIYYVAISTTVFIDFSDTFHYANEWAWTLNGTLLYPVLAKRSRNCEQENPQNLGTIEAVTENASNAWSFMMTLYVDNYVSTLLDTLNSENYSQETVYQLRVNSPTETSNSTESFDLVTSTISKVSNETTTTLFKLIPNINARRIKTLDSITGTYSALLKTYTALLATDTAGIAFNTTDEYIYLKIATATASTPAELITYLTSNTNLANVTHDGIYKPVIIKEHTDPQALGEKVEATFTFVLSNTPYSGVV